MTDQHSVDAIAGNLSEARARMARAISDYDSKATLPRIIAVTKRQPLAAIEAALAAGHRLFGENRVQEAAQKWPELRARHPDIALHMIGPLQTNKVRDAVRLFDVIETLDRPKLAHALADAMAATGRRPRLFIQVNTGAEPQKGGVLPEDLPDLLALCRDELGLEIEGLMCIPPRDEEPALHFALLKTLAQRHGLAKLSMGMSSDFEIAAAIGCDHVRLGTALFGERH